MSVFMLCAAYLYVVALEQYCRPDFAKMDNKVIALFDFDQFYMQQAMMLARRGLLTVSPNPAVGCVIVKNGQIIAEGYHRQSGDAHAEIYALRQAGNQAKGATVYVTLEPCCHHGRTGPCVEALIQAQVARVVIGSLDPNPCVAGRGVKMLDANGIVTKVGVLDAQLHALNRIFFHYHQYQKPFVIAKWAMSLDGKIVVHPQDSKQISNELAHRRTHDLRNRCDAILVGAKTVMDDNPSLTVRSTQAKIIKQPLRIVVCHNADKLPLDSHIFNTAMAQTLIACTDISSPRREQLQQRGVELYHQANAIDLDLERLLTYLGQRGITSILVEGGMNIHHQFARLDLIDEIISFVAPCVIGEQPFKKRYQLSSGHRLGDNMMLMANKGEQPYV